MDPAEGLPFLRIGPALPASPVVIAAVPHAGRAYPPALLAATRLLAGGAGGAGGSSCRSADPGRRGRWRGGAGRAPGAGVDRSRPRERELDPAMIDPLLRRCGGRDAQGARRPRPSLPARRRRGGVVAAALRGGGMWAARIAGDHRPWHAELATCSRVVRARFGVAVLEWTCIPCRRCRPAAPRRRARLVIGDRHEQSAAPLVRARCAGQARLAGIGHARQRALCRRRDARPPWPPEPAMHPCRAARAWTAPLSRAPICARQAPAWTRRRRWVARAAAALARAALASVQPMAAE